MTHAIRLAALADLPVLRAMFVTYCAELDQRREPGTPRYPIIDDEEHDRFLYACLAGIRGEIPAFRILVATDGPEGRILGFTAASMMTRAVGKPRAFCQWHWTYTVPEARAHGIGAALAASIFKWCVDNGVEAIEGEAVLGDRQWDHRGGHPWSFRYMISVAEAVADLSHPRRAPQTVTEAARAVSATGTNGDRPIVEVAQPRRVRTRRRPQADA